MDGGAGHRDNDDDGRNDFQELARVIWQSQREPYPKIDIPLFDGNHASSWADKFEQLGYSNEWTDEKMLRMVKRYCQVEYRDEIDELVRISRNWPDFKARLLEKYQLSDRLLDLRDFRAVDHKKFGTTKQFLSEFESVARLIPDLSDKDRCLIFLENFNDVEQSKLVEGMQGRYDWTKVRQNARVGKFDDILYRLLRQQKEERKKVKLGEVKDGEIYKTLTCMREIMEGMKEERLKFQVMLAKEKNSKRKGKESMVEESDSESEEEKEPPRKLIKAERKVLNQIRGGQGTSRKQGKNDGQNNQGGNGGAGGGSSGQNSQDQGQFQPQGGRGRDRGRENGQRSRWVWQQEATCNYCAEKGHIMQFCQLLSRDEKEGIVFTTICGEVFDYEGNLIDPNIEGGMRKEAFRRMGRPLPATFRVASPEEARLAEVEEAMASLHIGNLPAEPQGFRKQVVERARTITRRLAQCRDSIIRLCVDMEEVWPELPNVFLFGEWGDKREDASGQAGTSAPREASQTGPIVSTMRPRPVLKRSAPTVAIQTRMRRRNEQLQKEREPEKVVEEEPIPVSENDEDNEDEKLRAEEEERARRYAMEREPEKGKDEASEEEPQKKKNIYSIPVEQGVDIERLVDKILESQRDLVTLKEILAVSPKIREEFKQRMTRKRVMIVNLGEVIPPEANWSPPGTKMDWRSVSTSHINVQIGQQEYSTLVDDEAEMNIIRERHAIEAGLKINRDDYGFFVGASGSIPFCGTSSGVLVTVGKVKVRSYFYVLPRVEHEVLLGRAFLCRSESIIINKHDGTMFVILCDLVYGYYEVVKCANTGHYCSRNRLNPESYTFSESEKLRREKKSLGEEPNAREFSLTLPDIWQSIDFVSAHAAIDPNVVQALTEIITDTGSAETMRLVYSPSEGNKGEDQELPSTRQGPFLEDAGLTPAPNVSTRKFAARVEHLRKLVRKGQKWEWGPKQQAAVEDIKTEFREGGLILGVPFFDDDEKRPFVIETDAGPTALGGVLIQKDDEGQERPLRFESRTLNAAERNYSQFKKETLVVLHCFRIFRNYVFGRRFILQVDPTALAQSLRNYSPVDPTIARWLTYILMFDFEIVRISGSQNRADGLSRVEWDPEADRAEESVPVDAFLKEEDSRLSINTLAYLTDAATRYGKLIWNAPAFHEVRSELVVEEPFIEKDPWGEETAEEMMRLALTDDIDLMLDPLTIEQGNMQADDVFEAVGRMSFIMNLLVHEDRLRLMNAEEGGSEVKEALKEKEYEGEYKKIGMWLNGELNESEVDPVVREKNKGFVVHDGHLFKKVADGVPKRVVCGTSRQLDLIAALHDGVAGGHRSARVTLNKIQRLYFWEGMSKMVIDFCKSCFPCQQRSNIRYLEPLNPRYVAEPGAVVHLNLLVMPPGINGYRYIFDARDNLTGFVDGRVIRERTGSVLTECIEEYYLRYPFVQEIVMDRGGEFRAKEVQTLLKRLGFYSVYDGLIKIENTRIGGKVVRLECKAGLDVEMLS
ncbi:hypothetical protein CBR_g16903 [Chara braunii]|uniref:Integrase catalytic domain-containing protein n=1 Tax=Chara braunii TaxID=69332 RepID=A0A388KU13_CHABU|nr:hypothetical protein CBR_g16903 [Chara braunii]|eukprot:GBG73560.1 hypothetical protein CBR_g16903 [Chara braunii]